MRAYRAVACAAFVCVAVPANAEPSWLVQPVQAGQETVRYLKGVPTIDLELADGVVQITPMPFDHGSLVFAVAVYNDSERPANFGIENVGVAYKDKGVQVFSKDDLVRKAKNRATWTQVGLALLGGVAAGAAASQQSYYRSTWITPRGTYFGSFSGPSLAGQLQANAIVHDTAFGIAAVQYQLDRTVEALGDQVVQTTTVYPGESYAGRVVLAKIKPKPMPALVNLVINWNGEAYPFTFQVAKRGTPAPVFTAITRQSDLIDFRVRNARPSQPFKAASPVPSMTQIAPAESPHQALPAQEIEQKTPSAGPAVPAGHGLSPNASVRCETCR